MLTLHWVHRRPRPQMPRPECWQRNHRRAEDQPRPCFRVGFRAHQDNDDRSENDRDQYDGRTDQHAQEGVDQAPTGRAASSLRLAAITTAMPQRQRDAVQRCPAPGRARGRQTGSGPAPLASISQPARTPRPTVAPADEDGRQGVARAGLRRGAGRGRPRTGL